MYIIGFGVQASSRAAPLSSESLRADPRVMFAARGLRGGRTGFVLCVARDFPLLFQRLRDRGRWRLLAMILPKTLRCVAPGPGVDELLSSL